MSQCFGLSFEEAAEILSPEFAISVANVERHLDVHFALAERERLTRVPFAKEVLQECAKTHLLFPGFPLTILEMRESKPELFCETMCSSYEEHQFTSERVVTQWYLLRAGALQDSLGRTLVEQTADLDAGDDVPTARVAVLGMLLHHLTTGKPLFADYYVRTADAPLTDQSHACVGSFGARIDLCSFWDNHPYELVGLSAYRWIPWS